MTHHQEGQTTKHVRVTEQNKCQCYNGSLNDVTNINIIKSQLTEELSEFDNMCMYSVEVQSVPDPTRRAAKKVTPSCCMRVDGEYENSDGNLRTTPTPNSMNVRLYDNTIQFTHTMYSSIEELNEVNPRRIVVLNRPQYDTTRKADVETRTVPKCTRQKMAQYEERGQ